MHNSENPYSIKECHFPSEALRKLQNVESFLDNNISIYPPIWVLLRDQDAKRYNMFTYTHENISRCF